MTIIELSNEALLGAFVSIAAYFAYLMRYLLIEMKSVIDRNTDAVLSLALCISKNKKP